MLLSLMMPIKSKKSHTKKDIDVKISYVFNMMLEEISTVNYKGIKKMSVWKVRSRCCMDTLNRYRGIEYFSQIYSNVTEALWSSEIVSKRSVLTIGGCM